MTAGMDAKGGRWTGLQRWLAAFVAATLLLGAGALPAEADSHAQGGGRRRGRIVRLTASDAPDPDTTITVSSQVQANVDITRSNLFYIIISPNRRIVATHRTSVGALAAGATFSDSWTVSNSSFPVEGTYSLFLCWSTGAARRCNIAVARTTFFSVPTLGWTLSLVGAGLIAMWIWRRRADFRIERA